MLLDEGMPERPRRGERAGVVPITPDRAAPTDGVVDRACEPDSEPPHAARQARAVLCLDDQVDVIVLDRVMDDPEPAVGGRGQPTPDGREDPGGAEAADGIRGPERDVDGMRSRMWLPGTVRDARSASRSDRPSGSSAAAAPRAGEGSANCIGRAILIRQ